MYRGLISANMGADRNPPLVHIEVPLSALKQLESLKVGNEVHVLLVGKLVEKSERKPTTSMPGFLSSIMVEVRRFAVEKDEKSMQSLMDD